MKIIIDGKQVTLHNNDVKTARKLIRDFLSSCKDKADEKGANTFYYTMIITMYVMANDYIEAITPELLSVIFEAQSKNPKPVEEQKYKPLIEKPKK